MQQSNWIPCVSLGAVTLFGALFCASAKAESTTARRILNIEQAAHGDLFLKLEGWTCSPIRDFVYMPADAPEGGRVLSILLAALLSKRPVDIYFTRTANGNQCDLGTVTIQ